MTHLSSDEFIDAMDGALDATRQSHLDTCSECQRVLGGLSWVRQEARLADVPEPSPLFWQSFSARIRGAIDSEAPTVAGWGRWLRWPVLASAGALSLLILAFNLYGPAPTGISSPPVAEASAESDVVLAGDSWAVVADLVGTIDWETARESGLVIEPGAAERAALELSSEERQELGRLLRAAIQRAES